MTQDELEKEYFSKIYDILVSMGGASEYMRSGFIALHTTKGNEEYGSCDEYRFSGHFLFGGKYRRKRNKIDYYSEDQNKTLDKLEAKINAKLAEIYEEYRAKGLKLEVYQS